VPLSNGAGKKLTDGLSPWTLYIGTQDNVQIIEDNDSVLLAFCEEASTVNGASAGQYIHNLSFVSLKCMNIDGGFATTFLLNSVSRYRLVIWHRLYVCYFRLISNLALLGNLLVNTWRHLTSALSRGCTSNCAHQISAGCMQWCGHSWKNKP
jgi:hypothetical protein